MVCDRPLGIEFLPDESENLRIIGDRCFSSDEYDRRS